MKRTDAQLSRRTVIAGATLIPIAAIKAAPQSAASAPPATVFSAEQRRVLDAFVSLVPKDENGPGAVECGAADYIDRCLADYLSAERASFLERLAAMDAFARSSQGAAFVALPAEKQDAVLTAMENNQGTNLRGFFNRVARPDPRRHVQRSLLGRQPKLRGLGSDPLSRRSARRRRGRSEHEDASVEPTAPPTEARNMATNLKPVDVAVVGLGAAGGVAVLPLARAGLKVAAHRSGKWMKPSDFQARRDSQQRAQAGHHRDTKSAMRSRRSAPARISPPAATPVPPMMNAVGGTSIHYYANSWRFHPWDFQVRSETDQRYGASAIPKGTTLEDWPLTYDELEPYYDTVEYEIGVSGKAGNIQGKIDPRGNIFEGPRRREYPMPPLRDTDFTDMMQAAARKLGWNPHRGPAAINSQPHGGRPACAYHGYCDTGGCHVSAKNSTAVTTIPRRRRPRT